MWKNKKSEVKQITKLKQCIVRRVTYNIYLHFELWSVLYSVVWKITKIRSWCTILQVHIFFFCREFNTSGTKVLNIVACIHAVVTQRHNINFISATFTRKLRTCRDKTRQHWTQCAETWELNTVLILARQWRESFRQQLLQINGTKISHHLNSMLYTPSKLTMQLSNLIYVCKWKEHFH